MTVLLSRRYIKYIYKKHIFVQQRQGKPSFGAGYPVITHNSMSHAFLRHQHLANIRNCVLIQTTVLKPGINPNNSETLHKAAVPLSPAEKPCFYEHL